MNVQGVSSFQNRDHRRSAILPGYMSGFGNSFETEALEGALPIGRNSPQKIELRALCRTALGLALHRAAGDQSALMALSHPTERQAFGPLRASRQGADADGAERARTRDLPIGQLRWDPTPFPDGEVTFLGGLRTITTAGDSDTQVGMAAHVLLVTASMTDAYFFNADGEYLVVAQENALRFRTEFGIIDIEPGEICHHSARRDLPCRTVERPCAGLSCAKTTAARSRCRIAAHRRQLSRERARFSHPGRRLRGQGRALVALRQMGRRTLQQPRSANRRSTSSRGTAITRPTNTTCVTSRRSARSCSIIPIRRSSR